MEQKNRKCAICNRNIADSWGELEDHLLSRDDIPDDIREVFRAKEHDVTMCDELYFTTISVPFRYHRYDDEETVDGDSKRDDSAYRHLYYEDIQKQVRIPEEKIKHMQLHIDLCYICATVLHRIHSASNQYTNDCVQHTCITLDNKLTAEIVVKDAEIIIKDVTERD